MQITNRGLDHNLYKRPEFFRDIRNVIFPAKMRKQLSRAIKMSLPPRLIFDPTAGRASAARKATTTMPRWDQTTTPAWQDITTDRTVSIAGVDPPRSGRPPWPAPVDHLGLVVAVDGFGEGIVIGTSDIADVGLHACFQPDARCT